MAKPELTPPAPGTVVRLSAPGVGAMRSVVVAVYPNLRELFARCTQPTTTDELREQLASAMGAIGIIVEDPERPPGDNARMGLFYFGEGQYTDLMGLPLDVKILARPPEENAV